ncbi:hypothetical protein [Bacillus atrophaeus]|uniref:Bacteriocin n=1 Tax=Bacillus atrophaeus (strain 1942) TaxID=720555 RepID=A0ABM5LXK3_BACA1|nr:hypothetical protein [Bacillus atrophaeus]ADP32542.1 hypothetical protein BATR1942_08015 [Bacillus atrophaeus 1942]AIK45670.1 hypothetical protein DJ95_1496 [Bacillus atrophaeus subsp. globigii]EIM11664.1 hypothetical protein UY9_05347 [Bacillus atrophaeus C89]KFK84026.1 hypothetical protein DK44_2138 [Bacillus atrophaeus]MEC1728965.1 hypothetical protein [Bacillus atrophaeus]
MASKKLTLALLKEDAKKLKKTACSTYRGYSCFYLPSFCSIED